MNFLLTGASGFLGRHIVSTLSPQHAITTLGRASDSTIKSDLSTTVPQITQAFDAVIHAAGKAHIVPRTDEESKAFYDVNLSGTQHLCEALDKSPKPPAYFVFISTVAVYGVESGSLISESHPLDGKSPYAQSKAQAEEFLRDWCRKRQVNLTILRLPLIAGTNPPGNLGAMIKGISSGKYFNIGGGTARKSVVHADDVARLIPQLQQANGTYNLTDGYHPAFHELATIIANQLGRPPVKNLPVILATGMAKVGDLLGNKAPINSAKLSKILDTLTFDDSKARAELGWAPSKVLDTFKI